MLRIHYFASVREAVGREREQIELPANVVTVADLIRHLRAMDTSFERMLGEQEQVLVAVNQAVAGNEAAVADGDEVAFFPPMSGG